MTVSNAMRTFTAVPVPAVKHRCRRRRPVAGWDRSSRQPMLSCAAGLMLAAAAVSAAAPSHARRLARASPTDAPAHGPAPDEPAPAGADRRAQPVAVAAAAAGGDAAALAPTAAARPRRWSCPWPRPRPRPAPVATSAPGAVEGIQAPSPVNLPPVAVLPSPAQTSGTGQSVVPLGLLAAFVATLLIATGLTARRRL